MGEFATWTGFWTGVSVIIGLGLGWMNLNHFTGKSCSPVAVADLSKHAPMICWWVWESKTVGETDLVVLTCLFEMSTDFVQWDEVLGLVALGFHQVMNTFGLKV